MIEEVESGQQHDKITEKGTLRERHQDIKSP